jgi:LPS O-antigen subunit length determinant protein (WzzB/FepE family)
VVSLKGLQNQVAYSTITLKLEADVSTTTPEHSLSSQVQETWNISTYSLREFSISLLRLGIWLMVYSPYLLILVAAIYGYIKLQKSNSQSITQTPEPHKVD